MSLILPNAPSLQEINKWLAIGMRPQTSGEAITVGSSNELGADRAVLSSNNNNGNDPNATIIDGASTNVFPKITFSDGPLAGPEGLSRALAPGTIRGVFIPSPGAGNDSSQNRWFTAPATAADNQPPSGGTYPGNATTGPVVDYLPYVLNGQSFEARTFRGVDWSGNVAVTSPTGTFSLQDISVFADIGFASSSNSAAVDISNSYYFPDESLTGLLMSDAAPNPTRGWVGGVDFTQVLLDLRAWRDYLRSLPVERDLSVDLPSLDLTNRNSIDSPQGPFVYSVPDAWDTNNDGIILIDVPFDGTDFQINNSDWVIEGTGNKLVVFRLRGQQNMLISNSSIMLGEQFRSNIGFRSTGVLFVKVHPEEEFTSSSGSSDTVFALSNVVMNGVGLWDLNTIGDANTDTPYGGNATRTEQSNYTNINHSNAQGCGQFISGFTNMQNVRWVHCPIGVAEANASIDVEKEVSPDNGTTWFDADTAPGPEVPAGTSPQFRFVVTNTGNVTLTNVQVIDDVYGLIGVLPSLAPGASHEFPIITRPWLPGQQVNFATATGTYEGQTVTDEDPAYWVGVEAEIDVIKFVSPDNGVTWFDANDAPGPSVSSGTDPQFRFVVTNTGNVTLTNVQVTDDVYGPIGSLPSLAPGASFQWIITRPWLPGQQVNIATSTGTYEGITVTDTDPAYWFGAEAQIDVTKYVSPDNGITWLDANTAPGPSVPSGIDPQFKYVVTNTGNVTLTDVEVTDDVYGLIGTLPSLAPGASFEWIIARAWEPGQNVNVATAEGTVDGTTVTDTDPAYWFGLGPAIDVEKYVSVDCGTTFFDADTPPGPTLFRRKKKPVFKYVVTNIGGTPLTNLTLTDSGFGPIPPPVANLNPGESYTVIKEGTWAPGVQTNLATATGAFNGVTVADSDPANYQGLTPGMPVFPDISNPAPQNEIIDRLLETVALEELALAALINAEAEKIQAVACAGVLGPVSAEELAAINRSVQEVVEAAAQKEDRLRRKLERILYHKEDGRTDC